MRYQSVGPGSVLLLVILSLFSFTLIAQSGVVTGVISDGVTAETLIGASVYPKSDPSRGTSTDLDGQYQLSGLEPGTYTIVVSYISYDSKEIGEVIVKNGEVTTLNVTLDQSQEILGEVIVETTMVVENMNAIRKVQQLSTTVGDYMPRSEISKTPDSNTGEVLKRLSGTTVQDGKFAIIRGLSDRYNTALVDGVLMPSTEPDRKAFAFDLFPANVLDYMVVTKSAQPDFPGEFSGGVVQLQTRAIPERRFLSVQLGTEFNTISTFEDWKTYEGGGQDWLGMDDGSRALPSDFPSALAYREATPEQQAEWAKTLNTNWDVIDDGSAPMGRSFGITAGWAPKDENSDKMGGIFGLNYSAANEISQLERGDYNINEFQTPLYFFEDNIYNHKVKIGALANIGFKVGNNHKFRWNNSYNINAQDRMILRTGEEFGNREAFLNDQLIDYRSNTLFISTLAGEHAFNMDSINNRKIKLEWRVGYNGIDREQPDRRIASYQRDIEPQSTFDSVFTATFPVFNSGTNWQRFSSFLNENVYNGNFDITIPFGLLGDADNKRLQKFKFGGTYQGKERDYSARALGYIINPTFLGQQFLDPENNILAQTPGQILATENISPDKISLAEQTNAFDRYRGTSSLIGAYAMLENQLSDKLRAVWGIRYEKFDQTVGTGTFSTSSDTLIIEKSYTDLMPSLNLIYALTDKINLRLSGSKTTARPMFREIAPSPYYDFEYKVTWFGDSSLTKTDIYNADFRVEFFPGEGQLLSASAYYKYFENPIAYGFRFSSSKTSFPLNEPSARNFGFELEIRKNLGFLKFSPHMRHVVFAANFTYINASVEVSDSAFVGASTRALQYQPDYLFNVSLGYANPDSRVNGTILFNQFARWVDILGYIAYPDIYRTPFPKLDAQLSIGLTDDVELTLSASNLLNSQQILYQDIYADDPAFNDIADDPDNHDNLIERRTIGTTFGATIGWDF